MISQFWPAYLSRDFIEVNWDLNALNNQMRRSGVAPLLYQEAPTEALSLGGYGGCSTRDGSCGSMNLSRG